MSMYIDDVLKFTDWRLLRRQKQWLIETANLESEISDGDCMLCSGIINFIDSIQDAAVDSGLLSESIVFGEING